MIDLSNRQINDWTVLDEVLDHRDKSGKKQRAYNCVCKCGTKKVKSINSLTRKRNPSKSCGCSNGIKYASTKYKKQYIAWLGMKNRCYNKNEDCYRHYGGRGIKVCDRWKDSFANFLSDIPKPPKGKCYFDKIDNNKDYQPGNVRWVSTNISAYNRRTFSNNTSGFKGVSRHKKNGTYIAYITVENKRIHLGSFSTIEEAIKARKDAELKYY